MRRSRFTQSCDPDVRAAARRALLAKAIAGVAIICGILIVAVQAPRDLGSEADQGQLGGRTVPSAAPTDAVEGTDAPALGRHPDDPLRLDPAERNDYWATAPG
jgi:hypothetical protein